MELREKIVAIIQDAPEDGVEPFVAEQAADAILALPEIAEALETQANIKEALRGGGSYSVSRRFLKQP